MGEKRNSCKNKKIVFMGTPEIATYALNALLEKSFDVVAVVCQPDKPIGRKKEIIFSSVKKLAIEKNIKFFQPNKIKEIENELKELNPFAFVTCAFGQFIPDSILSIPEFGCINIHASLLPKYRGGAPIHWAVINGEKETGVCLMRTIKQMDAGDVYCSRKVNIEESDTTSTLFKKMNNLVYDIVLNDLEKVFNLEYPPIKQDESKVSFAYNISKDDEKINFEKNAVEIVNLIRGLSETPGAYCFINDKKMKLFKAVSTNSKSNNAPGTINNISKEGILISTKDFDILVKEVQIEGKNRQEVKNILNGNSEIKIGVTLK
ncbi:methionyl-tRNA formyltransferase [Malacoplasma penetrans]|uniref:Methionyl-tRNA formyltransferase n=1 Tax=Malacoplasma penetrans (strain HF-2) TaxID=272633 RepID=FMT_MALP2|nr:methionyl-tRNA formyltransferase [Malacoplasma penetrans]Q8EX00.1 RecName: Full=Methionyl-tRNA formyltransferase [Malacoplasma penetrans HF-2]RXY97368.1 methionyl-tRNA formyltransferase [Malacoplasma penetrans]BAC43840.1 methionyl-tRNA formyltransferase [Malacoplasma penetrans HF-2]